MQERTINIIKKFKHEKSCVHQNVTPAFQTRRNFASKRKRTPKRIQVDEIKLTSMEGKVAKCNILHHCSQITKQYFNKKKQSR